MPDLFPFLLEVYTKEGKTEEVLREDIKKARESYKELLTVSKRKQERCREKVYTTPKQNNPHSLNRVPYSRI